MTSDNSVIFKTIEIEKLILLYVGFFLLSLITYWLTGYKIHTLFFMIVPVLLYFLCLGKMDISFLESRLILRWIRKPIIGGIRDEVLNFSEIIRWKYNSTGKGPDEFKVILSSGRSLKIRPSIFSFNDLYKELFLTLDRKMYQFHQDRSKQDLFLDLYQSGYIGKLKSRMKALKLTIWILTELVIFLFALGCFAYPETSTIWVVILVLLAILIILGLAHHFTKNEYNECLSWE